MKRLFIVLLSFIMVLGFVVGCSHQSSKSVVELGTESLATWEEGTPNPLLNYVPSDAPFILSTQRSAGVLTESMKDFAKQATRLFGTGRYFSDFFDNYASYSYEYGLNPYGKTDAVLYYDQGKRVLHVTVEDDQKAINAVGKTIEHFIQELRSSDDDYEDVALAANEDHGWKVYSLTSTAVPILNCKIGARVRNHVLTVVLWESDKEVPNSVLSGVKDPYQPVLLRDAVFTAHLDYAGIGKFYFTIPRIVSFVDGMYLDEFPTSADEKRIKSVCDSNDALCQDARPYSLFSAHSRNYLDSNGKVRYTPKDWIQKIGTTSVGDDVCLNAYQDLFTDLPSVDLAVSINASGKYGFHISGPVVSEQLREELEAFRTEYVDLKADPNLSYGHLGLNVYDAMRFVLQKAVGMYLVTSASKCAQLKGFIVTSDAKRLSRELERFIKDEEIKDVFRDMKSISIVTNDTLVFRSRDSVHALIMNMQNSFEANRMILDKLFQFDESIVNGEVATGNIQGEPIHAFFDNKSVTLGTEQYDVRAQYPKKKDTYLSMHLSPSFMHKLMDGMLPEWDSGYDIEFDLKDGRLYLIVETVQN